MKDGINIAGIELSWRDGRSSKVASSLVHNYLFNITIRKCYYFHQLKTVSTLSISSQAQLAIASHAQPYPKIEYPVEESRYFTRTQTIV